MSILFAVKDQAGAKIPGANVKVLSLADATTKELATDFDGELSIDLPAGLYDVVIKSTGFLPETQHLEVRDGGPRTIDIVLRVGMAGPASFLTNPLLVSFPEHSAIASPDGHYALVSVDSKNGLQHTFFLEDLRLKTRRKLFNYSNHLVLLWNYSSKVFAVTDYVGSEKSSCKIFCVDEKLPVIDAQEQILEQLYDTARKALRNLLSNHQVYIEALMWMGPMELEVTVRGHRDANHSAFKENYGLQAHFGPQQPSIISPLISPPAEITPLPLTRSPVLGNYPEIR